jgi:hypothetical protein
MFQHDSVVNQRNEKPYPAPAVVCRLAKIEHVPKSWLVNKRGYQV